MVISRTPLRVSLVGGGSDITSFAQEYGGAVVSTAIDKYIHVVVTERFEDDLRISYSETEIVDKIDLLRHDIVREALRAAGPPRKIELITIADVPARGTGLGSSSAVAVGALASLFAHQGILKSAAELAELASAIEIETLGKPIGKQDQYAAAFGGLNLYRFGPGARVERLPIILSPDAQSELERNLLMFYTGVQRSADQVLSKVDDAITDSHSTRSLLAALRDLALQLYEELGRGDPDIVGAFLDQGWRLKRELAGVTSEAIDGWYERARNAGAAGGKLLGAGGGGFLLLYVTRDHQEAVRRELDELRELPFSFEPHGSRIIFIGR